MVGIVIVSHSATLADGIHELIRQMTQGQVPLVMAGGIDDPANPIGTDAMKIYEAIMSVYGDDGVLVLMDLGSAVLSAETALEFLSPEQRPRVRLCPAPIVEGAIIAAVQSEIGNTLEQIVEEASHAVDAKTKHLNFPKDVSPLSTLSATTTSTTEVHRRILTITNRMGIHARPAAQLVLTANQYKAELFLKRGSQSANAKSMNQVTMLGVQQNEDIVVEANGPEAKPALQAIADLVANKFNESDEPFFELPNAPTEAESTNELIGIPASPGIAIGPVRQYRPQLPEVPVYRVEDTTTEWFRLLMAVNSAKTMLEGVQRQAKEQLNQTEAAIFEVQSLFLSDPDLLRLAQTTIEENRLNAEAAWQQTIETLVSRYQQVANETVRDRASDVVDIGQRVLHTLLGQERPALVLTEPVILFAKDLTPSDTLQLDPTKVLGICTELGGATAHSVIVARSLGIPAVVGLREQIGHIPNETIVALNGQTGQLWLNPTKTQLVALQIEQEAWLVHQSTIKSTSKKPAITQDDFMVKVMANISSPADVEVALDYGAEGVGLFRTEYLFMERDSAPTEQEQTAIYQEAASRLGNQPLIIRTLDVGGDKPLPYLSNELEDNPFLGCRGIRTSFDNPALFKTQLRAILRASVGQQVKIMFPMISTIAELRQAKTILATVKTQLEVEQIPFDKNLQVGMMIEVPAAVAVADQLAAEVDFFSIGTNDLTQYTLAADRGNRKVAKLVTALQPAVLRLIQQTVEAGHLHGIEVGLCGELAGNPLAAPLLVGLGLDELSMSSTAIPAVKAVIRELTLSQAQSIAQKALNVTTIEEVAALLSGK